MFLRTGATMENRNGSLITEFFLVGLSENPHIQIGLFFLFFGIYLFTLFGNITLVTVCVREPRLHTPMYFFLVNLSILDICFSTSIIPNMLFQLLFNKRINFSRCAAQMYAVLLLGATECVLLAAMAYDRYVAILFPLRYTVIMNKSMCITLAVCCWLSGSLMAFLDTYFTMRLPFCESNVINHFFCEAASLLRLACADTFIAELVIMVNGVFALVIPSIFTIISYVRIIATIVGIRSSQARYKAFSTCASHLIVVSMFYSTAIFMYMKPVSKNSANKEKMVSVFYTLTPPMMNPLIYSLRNKDVKFAVRNFHKGTLFINHLFYSQLC